MPETLTETTVELNGVRLYTRRVGHGPPVVVLHGGPGAHHNYLLPQYDHLAEGGRTLLYYDQRGGGRSPVPRDVPVGWREHVVDLEALRGHWELDRLTLIDRKSTRLNSSHSQISYAVFCLKKKKKNNLMLSVTRSTPQRVLRKS